MVGRNEKCPCGSGKKFKACCIDKILEFPGTVPQNHSPIPGDVFISEDPKLDSIKSILREHYHLEKKNADFLFEMSTQLGLLGFPKDGILYAKKALKFCSKNNLTLRNSIFTNLAAMHSEIELHDVGLKYLENVSEGFGRKKVIEANIRRFLEPFENVRPLYEEAILEEPDFFLPYENIISRLHYADEKRELLIDTAFAKMPQSPIAALYWADKELHRRNYETLANISWIEQIRAFDLENSKEFSMPLFAEKCKFYIGTLELIHEISRLMFMAVNQGSSSGVFKNLQSQNSIISAKSSIETLFNFIDTTEDQFKCNVVGKFFDFAITYGQTELVKKTYSKFCDHCKKNINIEQSIFSSMYRNLKVEFCEENIGITEEAKQAKKLGEQIILGNSKLSEDFVNSFFDMVDDISDADSALDYAKDIFDKDSSRVDFTNVFEEFRLYWNLGIISGKANLWGLSELFFSKSSRINGVNDFLEDKHDSFDSKINEIILDTVTNQLNLQDTYIIIAKLGQKKIEEAEKDLLDIVSKRQSFIGTENYDEIINLIDWLKENSKNITFKNDFQNALQKFGFSFFVGAKPKLRIPVLSATDALKRHNDISIKSQIELHETLDYHDSLTSGDMSEVYNSIEQLIPNYRKLPKNAQTSLISAENYLNNARNQFDTAPSIMGYCKGLEIYLRKEVFEIFGQKFKNSDGYEEQLKEALNDSKINQFRVLITFLKSGYLELGNATQCLKLCRGKTSERVVLLAELRRFLGHNFPYLLTDDIVETIESLAKNYRNPAVHDSSFSPDDLHKVRLKVAEIINNCMEFRIIS